MDTSLLNRALLDFLADSPNSYFAVHNMALRLGEASFTPLLETDVWSLLPGHGYYVTRNGSSLIAFRVPDRMDFPGFQILATHCDSPTFRVKPNAELVVENRYVRLNIERYGGMICSTWLDKPLSVAGRLLVRGSDGALRPVLVKVDRDLLVIPNLCIHFDRGVNEGRAWNIQTDLLPLFSGDPSQKLMDLVAGEAGVDPDTVEDCDLFLFNRMPGALFGAKNEFLGAGRLDDMQCVFASLTGFLSARPGPACAIHCVFDNEEVGSMTRQGASSTFLQDVLRRILFSLGRDEEGFQRAIASSFMVSADDAQALHPNHIGKSDPVNRPVLNGGIVLKYNASQKYATDGMSGALFRSLCRRADVPVQSFVNRSDIAGGSTLGNLSSAHVPLRTADVGLPLLAMHSAWETGGALDTGYLARAAEELFSTALCIRPDGSFSFVSS